MTIVPAQVPGSSAPRIYGLDLWRAALLLIGPVVHANLIAARLTDYRGALPDDIVFASHYFRMPMFFFVSGFLSSHSERKSMAWFSSRMVQLGVPTFVVWSCMLVPLMLAFALPSPAGSIWTPMHLWFLVDLIIMTVPVYYLDRRLGFKLLRLPRVKVGYTFVAAVLLSTLSGLCNLLLSALHLSELPLLVAEAPLFAVFYLFGFLVQRNPILVDAIRATRLVPAGPLFWLLLVVIHHFLAGFLYVPHQHHFIKAAMYSASGLCSMLLCVTLLSTAFRVSRRSALVARISGASYTIYLLHVPVLFIATMAISAAISNYFVFMSVLLTIGFVTTFLIHREVVERYALAAFLLNGKRGGRAAVRVAQVS